MTTVYTIIYLPFIILPYQILKHILLDFFWKYIFYMCCFPVISRHCKIFIQDIFIWQLNVVYGFHGVMTQYVES